MPFFGIEPAIIDPVSGEEILGNDVEGVLAFKQPWPSMARTVWGAHKRYMDTYLNVYKGYYVSISHSDIEAIRLTGTSSLEMVLAVITKATTGSVAVSMMLSMFPATVYPPPRLRPPSSSTVSTPQNHIPAEPKLTVNSHGCRSCCRRYRR